MGKCHWIILCLTLILVGKAQGQERPHIVFCLIDDLGWNDVSFHGSLQIPTPNIDTLASNGVVLNNYYTQPLCTPSRAALMTGIHPIKYGLQYRVLSPPFPSGLNLNYTLLPQHLKTLGYKTHAIGKWHLGFFKKEYTPTYRGFDSHLGYWPGQIDYYNHIDYEDYENTSLPVAWGRALRRDLDWADNLEGQYATKLFTDEAKKLIRDHNSSQPFFLYLSHLAVHSANEYEPLQAPKKYINMARHIKDIPRRIFAGMTIAMDESIGEVFKALEMKDMLDNTIFIVSSDNGGEAGGIRGGAGSNWPLRGNKGTTWEAGVRGNGLIWSPLIKKAPRISTQLMSILDWLPTLYYAAGGNPSDLGDIDGQNMWDAISDDKPSPRTELLHNIDPVSEAQTIRRNQYKLVIDNYSGNSYNRWIGPKGRDNGVSEAEYIRRLNRCVIGKVLKERKSFREVTNEWLSKLNLTCNPQNDPQPCNSPESPCLFNVIEDPCEQKNIAELEPELVAELLALIKRYNDTAVPLVNRTVDPRADPGLFHHHWTNWADYL